MLRRVRWGSIVTVLFIVAAVAFATQGEDTLAVVLGLCSIAMAVLSLKEML